MKLSLDEFERQLLLKYGYPSESAKRKVAGKGPIVVERFEVELMVGDLSRSMNHGEVPDQLLEEVDALATRLEWELEASSEGD